MSDDESDEDTFVVFGNPLAPYEEGEPIKKQYTLEKQKVKDDKGRERFHGAFTGGFSAGYFNTVGSKEGWTPSSFVSSRDKRTENAGARPEDFMDTEDLGEYGIAPRAVKATSDFTSLSSSRKRGPVSDGIIPGVAALSDLVKPVSARMGIRLLKRLGWKEGQGIGPRRRKGRRMPAGGGKTYGCSLPDKEDSQTSSEEIDYISSQDFTFAPKDINPIVFQPKDDLHGLGYRGITPGGAVSRSEIVDHPRGSRSHRGKRGMSGQAFGVGALEDDDEDVYNIRTDMSNYDTVLGGDDNTGTYGWTAPTNRGDKAPQHYTDVILEGFRLMSTQQKPQKVYPPPHLPKDFRPHHIFTQDENAANKAACEIPKKSVGWKKNLDVSERREALGEKPEFKSVFDLISDKNKQHMKACQIDQPAVREPLSVQGAPPSSCTSDSSITTKHTERHDETARAKAALLAGLSSRFQSAGSDVVAPPGEVTAPSSGETSISSVTADTAALYSGSGRFKAFATDQEKQARYEKFLISKKCGNDGEYLACSGHMTEWERSKEWEEFSRAADLYRPMSSIMATRFTPAEYTDNKPAVDNKDQGDGVSEQAKAAGMKMYGRLTRDMLEWHPDRLLCKRFNIPDPYPDSTTVGLLRVKRDKFSVFNFLSFPGQEVSGTTKSGSMDQPSMTDGERKDNVSDLKKQKKRSHQGKPLAILATVDLRQPSQKIVSHTTDSPESGIEKTETNTDNKPEESPIGVTPDRPPMDIFKSVFGDSDSSSSEDEDENDGTSDPSMSALSNLPRESQPLSSSTQDTASSVQHSTMGSSPFDRLFSSTSNPNTIGSKNVTDVRLSSLADNVKDLTDKVNSDVRLPDKNLTVHAGDDNTRIKEESVSEIYGPPLPPTRSSSHTPAPEYSLLKLSDSKKKKKHKEKEKHKHKKKKSKHKRHKEKSKKKKKKKAIVISDSSSSNNVGTPSGSDVNSDPGTPNSNDDPLHTDQMVLEKLRILGKRVTAADFM